jgi:hypothetical protein
VTRRQVRARHRSAQPLRRPPSQSSPAPLHPRPTSSPILVARPHKFYNFCPPVIYCSPTRAPPSPPPWSVGRGDTPMASCRAWICTTAMAKSRMTLKHLEFLISQRQTDKSRNKQSLRASPTIFKKLTFKELNLESC